MKTSNLTSHYILLFNKHQFVCEGLPHYWSAERFWFFTQVGHVCAWINITSTEVNLLVDRATSWICRCSLACSGWRKGRWVYCDMLIWCTAVTHIKEVPSLLTTIFLYRLWCSTVWDFTISSSVYFQCHSYQLQISLCEDIKVPVVLIHTLLEEMPRIVKSKYIKHSANDHNVTKNSEVNGGRIPKAVRYGTFTYWMHFWE